MTGAAPPTPAGGPPPPRTVAWRSLGQEAAELPNLVTMLRIALIPLVLVFASKEGLSWGIAACAVFVVAAVTDFLDGYLARRLNLVTVLGQFLDPLADKLIVLSTLIVLVETRRAPAWLTIVLMARELAITGLRAIASSRGHVIAAGTGGKWKTVLQIVGISFLLIHEPLSWQGVTVDCHYVGMVVTYASLVFSLVSAGEYFWYFAQAAAAEAAEQAALGNSREKRRAARRENKMMRRARRHAAKE
ncbi:MAG: CDP-diacylglycerol--glycerol-3-phosphate 3-phosphatidyltransferase [Myxococcales bacterium]|nr:CDP-diacylglycerol--glycerol-3-phosphate 3-phosphatidyltransferase [Myxococcales bacterium]